MKKFTPQEIAPVLKPYIKRFDNIHKKGADMVSFNLGIISGLGSPRWQVIIYKDKNKLGVYVRDGVRYSAHISDINEFKAFIEKAFSYPLGELSQLLGVDPQE